MIETLDKKEKTKVVIGTASLKLDDFDEMVNKNKHMKDKMKIIEEELKKY